MRAYLLCYLLFFVSGLLHCVTDRDLWVSSVERIATPVLTKIAADELTATCSSGSTNRGATFSFEALARTLNGLAPWFELAIENEQEKKRRDRILTLAHHALITAINPTAKDSIIHLKGSQPLVEYAFLAQAFMRSPTQLWGRLPDATKQAWLKQFRLSRKITPFKNNWLLFAGEIEAFILEITGSCDSERLRLGPDAFLNMWYKGDGVYGDGKDVHLDYYNSYVIHPLLLDILTVQAKHGCESALKELALVRKRACRYGAWLERLIAPDGSYPAFGRSLCYRMGAFHLLAQLALRREAIQNLPPAQIRAALTAVIQRHSGTQNFRDDGLLEMGFNGRQPEMCDYYINRGSLYLCTFIFLPLGLPEGDPFWTSHAQPWTSKRAWEGLSFPNDHAI